MSTQDVIAVKFIKKGEPVIVHQGLVKPALEGIHKPMGEASCDIQKGELCTFNFQNRTLKKAGLFRRK